MIVKRRNLIKTAAKLPLAGMASTVISQFANAATTLPDKQSFGEMNIIYLNSASQHPISLASSRSAELYLSKRRIDPNAPGGRHDSSEPLINFAKIINADVSEVAYVENTTSAEQMIIRGLGLPAIGGHIITDEFHYPGSDALYNSLERRGVKITRIKSRDGKIIPEDIQKALRPDTKLVALSLVSMLSGFEYDIKAVCDTAHANGTPVYADIIQAAGSLPIDIKHSGLDFAACSSYKWLMGDFGIGFVFASKNAQTMMKRPGYGSMGFTGAGETKEQDEDGFPKNAAGLFTLGTRSYIGISILKESLPYILNIGVDKIHTHSRIMTDMLKEELPKIGYSLRTPLDSHGPLVVAWKENAREILTPLLNDENIQISTYNDRIRISPTVFNDTNDIEKLLNVLKKAN